MVNYMARRLLFLVPVVIGVVLLGFILTRILPGDPALVLAGENATPDAVQMVRERLHLDQPLSVQFLSYISGLLRGDLGTAWHTSHPVVEDFRTRFPATVELTLTSMFIAVIIGIPMGVLSAVRKNSLLDHVSRVFSMAGATVPIFWLGLVAIYIFYFKLHLAPAPMGRISIVSGRAGLYRPAADRYARQSRMWRTPSRTWPCRRCASAPARWRS